MPDESSSAAVERETGNCEALDLADFYKIKAPITSIEELGVPSTPRRRLHLHCWGRRRLMISIECAVMYGGQRAWYGSITPKPYNSPQ